MRVAPRALIDHSALRHNLTVVRRPAPRSRVWAVIKANAYGHGIEQAASSLESADGFAVARVEEAVRLREAGVRKPLLVLEGAVFADELDLRPVMCLETPLIAMRSLRLWGEGLPVDEIARRAGTISYELLCQVTSRVPVEHRRPGQTAPHPLPDL